MTIADSKEDLLELSSGRTVTWDDTKMISRYNQALNRVSNDMYNKDLVWLIEDIDNIPQPVLKAVDDEYVQMKPNKISTINDTIQVSDFMEKPLLLYVMAGLEPQKAKTYMGMYREEVEIAEDLNSMYNEQYGEKTEFNQFV